MNSDSDWFELAGSAQPVQSSFVYPKSLERVYIETFKRTHHVSGSDVLLHDSDSSSLSENDFIKQMRSSRYARHGVLVSEVGASSKQQIRPLALPKSLLPRLRAFIMSLPKEVVEGSPLCLALSAVSDPTCSLDFSTIVSDKAEDPGLIMRIETVFNALRAIMVRSVCLPIV